MSLRGVRVAAVVSVLVVAGCTTGTHARSTTSPASASGGTSSPAPTGAPTTSDTHQRPLTAGETELARTVFGDSVDYSVVRVHDQPYPLLGGFQPDDTAVTPDGEMYFPKPSYLPDFSADSPSNARWFVHEMVHVWQYQLGYPVAQRGMNRAALRYDYELGAQCGPAQCLFADYDMEQQGEIVADYAAMTTLGMPTSRDSRYSPADLPLYRTVLADFLADPADPANLPRR